MTGHEPTAPLSPQLTEIGERLQREFGGRLLALSSRSATPTLLSDDWWLKFDLVEKEMALLYQPIREMVLLPSTLTEGFVPSDLFSAAEPADASQMSEDFDVSSRSSHVDPRSRGGDGENISTGQPKLARSTSPGQLNELTKEPSVRRKSPGSNAELVSRAGRKPSLPQDSVETPTRNGSTPVRGLSELSAALRSNYLDEAWFSADTEDDRPAIAHHEVSLEPRSEARDEQISAARTVPTEPRRHSNLAQLGNEIVRQVTGGTSHESWRNSKRRSHPKELAHPVSGTEHELSAEALGPRANMPATLKRPAARREFASPMPSKPVHPALAEELFGGDERDFTGSQSPEISAARFAPEQPELVIPGAAGKVDVSSGHEPEDFNDIFDALASEIQRAYRRFYGV